jgi:hypothetical protein
LTAIRQASAPVTPASRLHPVKGDPFRDFAGFASSVLTPDVRLRLRPGIGQADLDRVKTLELDMFAANWRGDIGECGRVIEHLASAGETTVTELLLLFPVQRRRPVHLGLVWMAKQGFVDWL